MFRGRLSVTLYVYDIPESVDFYRWAFNFSFDGYWNPETGQMTDDWAQSGMPSYVELRAGENIIALQKVDEVCESARAEFRLEVIDIEGFYNHVCESGAEPGELTCEEGYWKMFTVSDPNGYTWQFCKQLKFGE